MRSMSNHSLHLEELANSPERRIAKMDAYHKRSEIGKMEDKAKQLERYSSALGRSIKSSSSLKAPKLADINARRDFYLKYLLSKEEQKKAAANPEAYKAEDLMKIYIQKKNDEMQKAMTDNIKKENEIDAIYTNTIKAKLEMLQKSDKASASKKKEPQTVMA